MTDEEAKRKVRGYLTDILPSDCSDEIDEIIKALEQQPKPMEKFDDVKTHIQRLAGDYKCWDNRLTWEEALELNRMLEAQPNRCDSCKHSEERDGSNCYECVKGIADNFEAQPTNMRDATEEERKSVKDYVDSVSKPTGVNFNELLRDCGTCKHNTGIDCGQYPCNECNRRTHPLYEPKIAQPTDAVSREAVLELAKKGILVSNDNYKCVVNAIKSLPSVTPQIEPCEDCISRQAVIDYAKDTCVDLDKYEDTEIFCDEIKALPPVTPKYTDEEIDRAQAIEQAYVDKMVELTVEELKRPKGKWIKVPITLCHYPCDGCVKDKSRADDAWCSSCKFWKAEDFDYRCSECDKIYSEVENYCPNCGSYNGGGEDAT